MHRGQIYKYKGAKVKVWYVDEKHNVVEVFRCLWKNVNPFYVGIGELEEVEEWITCAAIHFDDSKIYPHQPYNINSGLVFCGHRHGCIFPQIGGSVKERQELGIYEKSQGFLTNLNRYVEREEALQIALKANQILNIDEVRGNRLHSEDLYNLR